MSDLATRQDAADELADMVAITLEEARKEGYRMVALEHALTAYRRAPVATARPLEEASAIAKSLKEVTAIAKWYSQGQNGAVPAVSEGWLTRATGVLAQIGNPK